MTNILPFIHRAASGNPSVDLEVFLTTPHHQLRAALFKTSLTPSMVGVLRQIARLILKVAIDGLTHPEQKNVLRLPYPFALRRVDELLALADEYEAALRSASQEGGVSE